MFFPATATSGKAAHRVLLCAALLLIAMPPAAHANAGTPLMWAGILHLLFGNLFVGLMEGIILARAFRVELAFETPFLSWEVRNATHLPGDQVLFRLGDDQICLYDPAGDRIALVTRGWGPIAVIEPGGDASDAAGERPRLRRLRLGRPGLGTGRRSRKSRRRKG